jgi:protein-S-isoprenylcysteine O-methyltransferase Ste14
MQEHYTGDSSALRHPGVPFPPPFLFVAGFLAGLGLERWVWRIPVAADDWRAVCVVTGWFGVSVGLFLVGWGLLVFFQARTGIIPIHPARCLVTSGPYRFSRNPMYVGLCALYLGLALLLNVTWPVVLFPLVVIALFHLVIRREERYLADAFDDAYALYAQRVRRWL